MAALVVNLMLYSTENITSVVLITIFFYTTKGYPVHRSGIWCFILSSREFLFNLCFLSYFDYICKASYIITKLLYLFYMFLFCMLDTQTTSLCLLYMYLWGTLLMATPQWCDLHPGTLVSRLRTSTTAV